MAGGCQLARHPLAKRCTQCPAIFTTFGRHPYSKKNILLYLFRLPIFVCDVVNADLSTSRSFSLLEVSAMLNIWDCFSSIYGLIPWLNEQRKTTSERRTIRPQLEHLER